MKTCCRHLVGVPLALLLFLPAVDKSRAASWELLAPGGPGPGPRRGVKAVLDEERNRIVFQGAETASFQFLGETWFLDLHNPGWTLPAIQNPTARCHHTFLNDLDRGRALAFGGFPRNNELWEFRPALNQWTNITPADNPIPSRCLHVSVVCSQRNEMIVYGGLLGGFAPDLQDTWSYNLTNGAWTLIENASPPGLRYGSVAVLDEKRDRIVLFGGLARFPDGQITEVGDVWEFDLAARQWSAVTPSRESPLPRQFAEAVLLPQSDGFLLFGGLADTGAGKVFQNDLFFYDFADDRWQVIKVAGSLPPARFRHTLVLDEINGRLYLAFGEGDSRAHFNDVWRLDLNMVQLSNGRVTLRSEMRDGGLEISWEARPVIPLNQATNVVWPDYQLWRSANLQDWQPLDDVVASPKTASSIQLSIPVEAAGGEFFSVEAVSPQGP